MVCTHPMAPTKATKSLQTARPMLATCFVPDMSAVGALPFGRHCYTEIPPQTITNTHITMILLDSRKQTP
jgi:hypothetical protein